MANTGPMKLLEYTLNGLRSNAKCTDCWKWTPIKELRNWDGLCKSCYDKRMESANSQQLRTEPWSKEKDKGKSGEWETVDSKEVRTSK